MLLRSLNAPVGLYKKLSGNICKRLLASRFFNNIETAKPIRCYSTINDVDLHGIFPPIPTPFRADEAIAYDKLEFNFSKWNKFSFKGYVVEGSNGEYVYLSHEERIELVKKAREFIKPGKLLLAGSGCESTKETILMTQKMAEAGADAVMIVTPCYFKSKMKDRALHQHYHDVATVSPIPVILYNVPGNTGIELSEDAITDLAAHDNIIGMKESGGDVTKIASILHRTSQHKFQVLAGSAGFLLPSLQLGCVGGVCAIANVLCKETCDLYQLFTEGEQAHKDAVALQKSLIAPNSAVTKIFGVPGLKDIMDAKGFYGGPVRRPLQKLLPEETEKLRSIFDSFSYL